MTKKIDLLNIGLIALSLIIAIMLPFRLFSFSYAILGPLHYLTEINVTSPTCAREIDAAYGIDIGCQLMLAIEKRLAN